MDSDKNQCQTLSHYDELGEPVFKNKFKYETHDKAVAACKTLNVRGKQIKKLVTYKCKVCHKYHIGRNGKDITKKYVKKINNTIGKRKRELNLKIVGKIDLSNK